MHMFYTLYLGWSQTLCFGWPALRWVPGSQMWWEICAVFLRQCNLLASECKSFYWIEQDILNIGYLYIISMQFYVTRLYNRNLHKQLSTLLSNVILHFACCKKLYDTLADSLIVIHFYFSITASSAGLIFTLDLDETFTNPWSRKALTDRLAPSAGNWPWQ